MNELLTMADELERQANVAGAVPTDYRRGLAEGMEHAARVLRNRHHHLQCITACDYPHCRKTNGHNGGHLIHGDTHADKHDRYDAYLGDKDHDR